MYLYLYGQNLRRAGGHLWWIKSWYDIMAERAASRQPVVDMEDQGGGHDAGRRQKRAFFLLMPPLPLLNVGAPAGKQPPS